MAELSNDSGSRKLRRLKEYREKSGLTVEQLASQSGITEGSINAIEADESNATIQTAEALAGPLACHKEDLIGLTDQPKDWSQVDGASPDIDPPDDQ